MHKPWEREVQKQLVVGVHFTTLCHRKLVCGIHLSGRRPGSAAPAGDSSSPPAWSSADRRCCSSAPPLPCRENIQKLHVTVRVIQIHCSCWKPKSVCTSAQHLHFPLQFQDLALLSALAQRLTAAPEAEVTVEPRDLLQELFLHFFSVHLYLGLEKKTRILGKCPCSPSHCCRCRRLRFEAGTQPCKDEKLLIFQLKNTLQNVYAVNLHF